MKLSYFAQNPARARHVFYLSALSLSAGTVTALLPAESLGMRLVFTGTGFLLFLLLEIYTLRFTIVSFRYEIREDTFLVFRIVRKREKPVLSFPLGEISSMYPAREAPPGPKKNDCPTFRGKRITGTVIYYKKDGGTGAVVIECSNAFARALSREAVSAGEIPPGGDLR